MALAPPAQALAGEWPDVAPGNWVRITTHSEEGPVSHDARTATFAVEGVRMRVAKPATTVRGSVQSVADGYLIVAGSDGPIVVPSDAIWRLDVRRRASKRWLGALLGLFGGGAAGYVIGSAASGPGCQGGETGFAHLCVLDDTPKTGGAVLGALGGVMLGAIVAPGEKWDNRGPRDRVHATVAPTSGPGLGLSLKVAF